MKPVSVEFTPGLAGQCPICKKDYNMTGGLYEYAAIGILRVTFDDGSTCSYGACQECRRLYLSQLSFTGKISTRMPLAAGTGNLRRKNSMTDPIKLEHYRTMAKIICDPIGCGIDIGIRDVCVGLWLHGIWTHGPSCWGHEERVGDYATLRPFVSFPNDDLTMEMLKPLVEGFDLVVMKQEFSDGTHDTHLYHSEYGNNIEHYRQLQGDFLRRNYIRVGNEEVWCGEKREDKEEVIRKLREWQAEFTRFAIHLIETAE